ncbi:MAG: AtpZ/AtpI family protein [Planctomycetes bacterium]|nr:AtpZ/AtpI family protein [Planctomycetota bacterium]
MEKPGDSRTQENKNRTTGSNDKSSNRWLGFGFEFVGVICFFMWLGYLADQKFQTTGPWWLLTGFFVSFVGMIYLLIKETFDLGRRDK